MTRRSRPRISSALLAFASSLCFLVPACMGPGAVANASAPAQGRIDLPQAHYADSNAAIDEKDSFVLTISAQGELYLGGEKVTKEKFSLKILDALSDLPADRQKAFIRSDRGVKFSVVREVFNIIRHRGFDNIGLVVESVGSARGPAEFDARIFVPFGIKIDPADNVDLPERPARPREVGPPPPPPPPPSAPRRAPLREVFPYGSADALVIEMKGPGTGSEQMIALNTHPMKLSNLASTLSDLFDGSTEKAICIKPARDKSYDDLVSVLDEVKGAGAEFVGIVIDEAKVPNRIPRPPRPAGGVPGEVPAGIPGGVPGGVPEAVPPVPRIIRKKGVALARSATHRVEVVTPPLARAAKVTGTVVVEVTVDEEGEVIDARALSGHPLLKDSAVGAALQWKFTPERVQGKPVQVLGTLTLVFK